jgi:hypothetical protein
MDSVKTTKQQSAVIRGLWYLWSNRPQYAELRTVYTGHRIRFDVLPAATLVYANEKQTYHAAKVFNVGMYEVIEGNDVDALKSKVEQCIETYLLTVESKQ